MPVESTFQPHPAKHPNPSQKQASNGCFWQVFGAEALLHEKSHQQAEEAPREYGGLQANKHQ